MFWNIRARPTTVIFIAVKTTTTPTSGYRLESVGRLVWRRGDAVAGPKGYETEIPTLSPVRFPELYATVTSKFSHDPPHSNSGFTGFDVVVVVHGGALSVRLPCRWCTPDYDTCTDTRVRVLQKRIERMSGWSV